MYTQLGKFIIIMTTWMLITACSTDRHYVRSHIESEVKQQVSKYGKFGTSEFEYLSSQDLLDHSYKARQSQITQRKNIGALKLTKYHKDKKSYQVYTLHNQNSNFMAETKLFEENNKDYFFSFGINQSTKMPAMGFRVEF